MPRPGGRPGGRLARRRRTCHVGGGEVTSDFPVGGSAAWIAPETWDGPGSTTGIRTDLRRLTIPFAARDGRLVRSAGRVRPLRPLATHSIHQPFAVSYPRAHAGSGPTTRTRSERLKLHLADPATSREPVLFRRWRRRRLGCSQLSPKDECNDSWDQI